MPNFKELFYPKCKIKYPHHSEDYPCKKCHPVYFWKDSMFWVTVMFGIMFGLGLLSLILE